MIAGGEWLVCYPARCRLDCHIEFLPDQADERGWGSRVEREFEAWVARAAAADPWLRSHPPRSSGSSAGCRPPRCRPSDPVVRRCWGRAGAGPRGGARRARQLARRRDADRRGGHPRGLLRAGRRHLAHTADERVPSPTSWPARRASRSRRCASPGWHERRQRVLVARAAGAAAHARRGERDRRGALRRARRGARAGQPAGPELPPRVGGRHVRAEGRQPGLRDGGAGSPEPRDGARGGPGARRRAGSRGGSTAATSCASPGTTCASSPGSRATSCTRPGTLRRSCCRPRAAWSPGSRPRSRTSTTRPPTACCSGTSGRRATSWPRSRRGWRTARGAGCSSARWSARPARSRFWRRSCPCR